MMLLTLVEDQGLTVKVTDGKNNFVLPKTYYELYIKKEFVVIETEKLTKTKFIDKLISLKTNYCKITYTNKEDVEKTVEGVIVKISNLAKIIFFKNTREFITIDMRKVTGFIAENGTAIIRA